MKNGHESDGEAHPRAGAGDTERIVALGRSVVRFVRRVAVAGILTALAAGLLGQVLRDRWFPLGMLFYVPLGPVGLAALMLDLIRSGRTLPRPRFALSLLGGAAAAWSAVSLSGYQTPDPEQPDRPVVTVVQWNVQSGGSPRLSAESWTSLGEDIRRRSPEVVVLTEPPPAPWVQHLCHTLGAGWTALPFDDPHSRSHGYRVTVLAAGPLRREGERSHLHGHLMAVTATVHGRPLRLLAVDGQSYPFRSRMPLLGLVADECRQAAERGQPFDLVLGDFNTPSRSRGFDPFAELAGGYRLAGRLHRGWRATWPSVLPLYDIDHVWVHRRLPLLGGELFTNLYSDHRGQCVRVHWSGP